MGALLLTVLVASLVGNLHCGGMCGPFAALAVSGNLASRRGVLLTHAAYHGGRLITYSLLGAVCGAIGRMIDLGGAAVGFQRVAATLAGAMMVVFGVAALAAHFGVRLQHIPVPATLQALAESGHRRAMALSPVSRAAAIGLLSTILPCGWLYAFAVTAAGSGSAAAGALTMATFWVGTLPVLLAVGAGARQLFGASGRYVRLAASLAIVVVGFATVLNRGRLAGHDLSGGRAVAGSVADAAKQAASAGAAEMNCCHGD